MSSCTCGNVGTKLTKYVTSACTCGNTGTKRNIYVMSSCTCGKVGTKLTKYVTSACTYGNVGRHELNTCMLCRAVVVELYFDTVVLVEMRSVSVCPSLSLSLCTPSTH